MVEGGTSVLAPGKVVTRKGEVAQAGIVEPVVSLERFGLKGELVADNVTGGRARALLVNENKELVVVPKGVVIGLLHPLPECPASADKNRENIGNVISNLSLSREEAPTPEPLVEAAAPASVREEMESLFDLSHIDNADDKEELLDLLVKYEDVVSRSELDVGVTNKLSHVIDTGDACPIRQGPRRESPQRKEIIRQELDKLLSLGFIEESESPWGAPVVLVGKKDGTKRLCIDYRGLNSVTKKSSWPLPRIDDVLDALAGSELFSVLDLRSGYWQIPMNPESIEKTAFTTGSGAFQFKVLSFGLCNAPSTFARLMETVLRGLQPDTCLAYLDDNIVHSVDDTPTHLTKLEAVFLRYREANLKLNPKKCKFLVREVEFLGHIISGDGTRTDPSKVSAVRDWPVPRNVKDIQKFLGFANYYRKFCKGFAETAKPLTNLTRKGVKFSWGDDCQTAFETLKNMLTSSPVLAYPDFNVPFIVDSDASDFGIGGVLSQLHDGQERVVLYFSRTLDSAEQNYCTHRKEMLAAVEMITRHECYLLGAKFTLRTDHSALQFLHKMKQPTKQYARWLAKLASFDFDIVHRAGVRHGNADGLSRRPCGLCLEEKGGVSSGEVTDSHSFDWASLGYTLFRNPPADGNCQFSAVADQLHRFNILPDASAESLRALAVSYLTQHPCWPESPGDPLSIYLVSSEFPTWDDYVSRLALSGSVWGNHMTLEALARAVGIGIRVVKVTNGIVGKPMEVWPGHESPRAWVLLGLEHQHYVSLGSPAGVTINSLRTSTAQNSWLADMDPADISAAQLGDPTIGPVLRDKLAGVDKPDKSALGDASRHTLELYRDWDLLEVQNEVLYRGWAKEDGQLMKQLLVPRALVAKVLSGVHDDPAGGHLGVEKTKAKIVRCFYWPGLTKDVVVHVTCCDTCAKTKTGKRKPRAPLQPSAVGYPNKRIAIDIVGPLPKTSLGNKYVLVLSDYFSKWVEVFPMADETAATVARVIFEGWVCVHGPPERIHTDQGRNFESTLLAELCKFMRVGKTRTTPYHPQSDGMVERFNRTLGNILRAYVSEDQRDWDTHLPMVKFAFNTSEHATTKFTPYFVMHGREARLPVELLFGTHSSSAVPVQEYVRDMVDKFQTIFKLVADNTKQAHRRQKDLFDKKVHGDPFQEGDKVLLAKKALRKGLTRKLMRKFEGPYTVVERVGGNAYRIRKPRAANTKVVHFENMLPYREREEDPDYLPPLPQRARCYVLTPGTRARRQVVHRPGGRAPPVVVSGSSSPSDSGSEDEAEQPPVAMGIPDGGDPQNAEQAEEGTEPDNIAAQTDDDAADGVAQQDEDPVSADASTVGDDDSASEDGSDDSEDDAPGSRHSTRSRPPIERYGFFVNSYSMHTVNSEDTSSNLDNSSMTRQGLGIRESTATAGQVTPPLTEEQQGVCKRSKASDRSLRSWIGSIFRFAWNKKRANAHTKGK
ncbi:GIN1 [Branchiostoma lanceolatum]|uniref:Gypsy retrotransposon integrase-like protein 1 n=1 Tax=Branchiostoma lanceolatum TaxID=7740 RepID=A0A8J9ZIJ6_BRALA|nr:GIN1 [Branchiostoma lanceolatum]